MLCVFYTSGETGRCKWGGTDYLLKVAQHSLNPWVLAWYWDISWFSLESSLGLQETPVCFVFWAPAVMTSVILLLVSATALNSDPGTPQVEAWLHYTRLLYKEGNVSHMYVWKSCSKICKYIAWKEEHTHTVTHTLPDYALWPSAPRLSCKRPTHPGETYRVRGWSCTESARFRLHIYTQREGWDLASTSPSTVYAVGSDKQAANQKAKQWRVRMKPCSIFKSFLVLFCSCFTQEI